MKKRRALAFFIDYLVISLYLVILLLVNLLLGQIFNWSYDLTHFEAQLIATVSSVLPISLAFGIAEGLKGYTIGKYIMRIEITYEKKIIASSITRNLLKFLPWQLGHMGTIYGLYYGTDLIFYVLLLSSFSLVICYVCSFIFMKKPFIDAITNMSTTNKNQINPQGVHYR